MSHPPARIRALAPLSLGLVLALGSVLPVAAADPSEPPPPLTVAIAQQSMSYDPTTNKAAVDLTVTPSGAQLPWAYTVSVRGSVVAGGSTTDATVRVSLLNSCWITTQSVTVEVTDALDRTAGAAASLARSLCPPPPDVPHASDKIMAGPTLTKASFVDALRTKDSPALAEGPAIYDELVAGGVNPAFALGTFNAESSYGTKGYATYTRNWGNILYYSWEAAYGAVPYAPGNGYTYAKYPTWLASVRAYVYLIGRYQTQGYTTVSSASAHWLGTMEGSTRHLTYLRNITTTMSLLPDDAVPKMTSVTVPATSRAEVTVSYAAKDNLGVVGYEVRTKSGTGSWSAVETTTAASHTLELGDGTWTIGVRATDAARNWSPWMYDTVKVDATDPVMTTLATSWTIIRTRDGSFVASWKGTDDTGVAGYQYRLRPKLDGAWSSATSTSATSRTFKLAVGTWYLGVRARDAVGNTSDWQEKRVVVPVDDRAFYFSVGTGRQVILPVEERAPGLDPGMTRSTGSDYYLGTLTTTDREDATLATTFTGTKFYIVGSAGPDFGAFRVTIDGESTVIDTGFYDGVRATADHDRVLLFVSPVLADAEHRVTITNLATGGRPTIAIDGLGFAQ